MQENEKPKKLSSGGRKGGRKVFVLTEELAKKFENLCKCGCSIAEICAVFQKEDVTLKKAISAYYKMDFSVVFAEKRELQKVTLKIERMKRVTAGDTTMLIYLSKQLLGESDRQTIDMNFPEIDYSKSFAPDFTND